MERLLAWLSRTKVPSTLVVSIIYCIVIIPFIPTALAQFNTFLSYGSSAGAAPIVVTGIGGGKNTGNNGAGIKITMPSVTVPNGALIVCAVSGDNSGNNPAATDPGSNTYHRIFLQNYASVVNFSALLYAYNVTGFTGSVVISGAATNAANQGGATCIYATGIQTASDPHDATVDNHAYQSNTSSTSNSITASAAPAVAGSLLIGYVGIYPNSGTITAASGSGSPWTSFPATGVNQGVVSNIVAGYQVTSLSQTYTGTETGAIQNQYNSGITAFKP